MKKKIKKNIFLLFCLIIMFLLVGCSTGDISIISSGSDEMAIKAIADRVKSAIENKDVDMFMNNISLNYSDSRGGTYNSIYAMAEDMVGEIENAEDMAGSYGVNLAVSSAITNLLITSPTASSDFTLTVNAKFLFITVYSYSMDFEVMYQKEGTDWKIISLLEID